MRAQSAAPEGGSSGDGRDTTGNATRIIRAVTARKWQRFLRAILQAPRTSRELEHAPVFDHVAHSTASELRKKGVSIVTERVEIAGYNGLPAFIARYSVAPEGRDFAQRLLERQ